MLDYNKNVNFNDIPDEEPLDMDYWNSAQYGLPYPLYLYYLDDSRFTDENISVLGNCSGIQSIQYTPFIEPFDLKLYRIPYDVARFGNPETIRPDLAFTPDVFRIRNQQNIIKQIGTFQLYDIQGLTIGGERNWKNESRLYNYPYSFAMLTDYLNPPIQVKYHLCRRVDTQKVMIKQTLSDRCSYGLYIDDYKNDVQGKMESMVSGDAHELPCTSSAYSQWFASSRNQTRFGVQQSLKESFLQQTQATQTSQMGMLNSAVGGLMNTLGGFAMGGVMGGLMSGTGNMVNTGMSVMQGKLMQNQVAQTGALQRQGIIGSNLALQKDLQSTPNTLISMGSDVIYGIVNGEKRVDLIRFMLTEEYAKRIGDYFAMYGYKQNKLMNIRDIINTRYYYNYIKTLSVNINSAKMPKQHLEEFKSIFNNGTTIWHYYNDNVMVGDYSKDNYEYTPK